ncbi:hypothetical protein F2P81_012922 [Scophthalmus maximus]|uniref:Uncharacterized protein n=1 Tax=Scophthalmus maximus TaxID=52904 RepID=A0A6A4SVU3_SCOMX|nr:hypothetical protein F2P81_012922 [Scophthalmus maximus]
MYRRRILTQRLGVLSPLQCSPEQQQSHTCLIKFADSSKVQNQRRFSSSPRDLAEDRARSPPTHPEV